MNKIVYFINLIIAFIANSAIIFSSLGSYCTKGLVVIYFLLSVVCLSLAYDQNRTTNKLPAILEIALFTSFLALLSCVITNFVMNASLIIQVICSMIIIALGGCVALYKSVKQK